MHDQVRQQRESEQQVSRKHRQGLPTQPDTCLLEPTILSRLAQRVEEQTGAQVEML